MKGRKRHLIVDTLGLVLKAFVTEANYQDRTVASWLVPLVSDAVPSLRKLWADGGYRGGWLKRLPSTCPLSVEIVQHTHKQICFKLLPRRWVVERTFAWLSHYRRLSKDYEFFVATADAMIYAAMTHLMLRRLAPS